MTTMKQSSCRRKNAAGPAQTQTSTDSTTEDFELLNFEENLDECVEEISKQTNDSGSVELAVISIGGSGKGEPLHKVKITETRTSANSRKGRPNNSSNTFRDVCANNCNINIRKKCPQTEPECPSFLSNFWPRLTANLAVVFLSCQITLRSPKFWLFVLGMGYVIFLVLFIGCMLIDRFYYR